MAFGQDALSEEEEIQLMQHLKEHLQPGEGCPVCGRQQFQSGRFYLPNGATEEGNEAVEALIGVQCRNCSHYMFFGDSILGG